MLFQISLGVEIRRNEICLACLKASSRNIQLIAYASHPFDDTIGKDESSAAISELIMRFLQENRISPTAVFMGIPRKRAILRYLEYPLAVKENLRETLGYELDKFVPFNPEDVYFDFQIISENKDAEKLRLLLVVVKRQEFAPFLELSKRLKIGISGVTIGGVALCDFFSWHNPKDDGVVESFVYDYTDHFELGVLKNGMLNYSRVLPKSEADERTIAAALDKIRQEFAGEGEAIETIFCETEKGGGLPERDDAVDGIRFSRLDPSSVQISSCSLLVAYGLALRGVRKPSMDINLLPADVRKKPSKFRYYTMISLVSLILAGAMAWGGGIFLQRQRTSDHLDHEIQKLESRLKKFEALKTEKEQVEARIGYLNTLRRGGPPVLDILKELSERIPTDAWLSRFDFSEKGIQIEGLAASASELIPLLEASPMFGDVAFLSAISKRGNKDRFRIGLSLK